MQFKIFLIIIPGLEDLAAKEIDLKCPVKDKSIIKGGIETTVDLEWIDRAHRLLKIPTRILLRIESFKVKDFPKLYTKFSQFKWNQYLSHPEPNFEISASKSRLFHTDKIEKIIRDALGGFIKSYPLKEDWKKFNFTPQTFYIRIFEDELTMSLDLSGESLHKRGIQTIKGEAPLRETIASALIYELLDNMSESISLVDPMCGSGTFLSEALHFYEPIYEKKFSFEEAPFFKGIHLKKIKSLAHFPINHLYGYDLNENLLSKLKLPKEIELKSLNSLEKTLDLNGEKIFICNPPYGERISIQGKRGKFLENALKKFLTIDQPLRLGWLVPKDFDFSRSIPESYKLKSKRSFRNGGLAVNFWIFERIS